MATNEISSLKIDRGRRTYVFDICKSTKGDLYLKISESDTKNPAFAPNKVMIFAEDIDSFFETLHFSFKKFKSLKSKNQAANDKPSKEAD